MKEKRIAILHNALDTIGGAEIVTLILARELKADIYTTNIDREKINRMGFTNQKIFSIGRISQKSPFRQQSALQRFRKLNLKNKYDFFIISGDWAISGAVNNHPNIWYAHSALRELFDFRVYTKKSMVPWYFRTLFNIWVFFNRILIRKYTRHVNKIIANSGNTKNRISKYLKRNSMVIYPPIETHKYKNRKSKGYWLSVNRLLPTKRILLQLFAFSKLRNEKLVIVGSYENAKHFTDYARKINSIKSSNVEVLNWVDDKKLKALYSNCKGLITTSANEDFGMNVVEALSCGKPVIAPNEGGYRESIIHGKNGILIDNLNVRNLVESIKIISNKVKNNPNFYVKNCIKRARKFDVSIFIKNIKNAMRF